MKRTVSGIIVLGGHVQALGIIRILGRLGYRIVVIDNTNINISRHSKYCHRHYVIKDAKLLSFLLAKRGKYINWAILPTGDYHVKILSKYKDSLEQSYFVCQDSWDKVEKFYNKKFTYTLASQLDIPIPKTYTVSDISQLEKHTEFPCIIKPSIRHTFYHQVKKKVFICNNQNELRHKYRRTCNIIPADEILIQSIIVGDNSNQYSVCGFYIEGKPIAQLTACRYRQHPINFGYATTYAETTEKPQLEEYAGRIIRAVKYTGICEIEFKYDSRDKQYKLLEVNPRTWKWHVISQLANIPFLELYLKYLNKEDVKPLQSISCASYRHLLTDLPMQFMSLLKGYKHWNRRNKPLAAAVWAKDDPLPALFQFLYLGYFIISR